MPVMKRLKVGIIDIVSQGPTRALYARIMNAEPGQYHAPGSWRLVPEAGHEVTFVCYTGFEDLLTELPDDVDVVFIGAFTEAAHTAYALSNLFRGRGASRSSEALTPAVTPKTPRVISTMSLGFTDEDTFATSCGIARNIGPTGVHFAAASSRTLPGSPRALAVYRTDARKAPFLKMVPMLGSMGCPYTCAFCIDAAVPYRTMDFEALRDDLRFLLTKFKRPLVAWHDPNFGVRFDDYLDMIEDAVPPGSIDFVAESSLLPPFRTAPQTAQTQFVQRRLARHRILVRAGRKIEDRRPARNGQGSPGLRTRQPDPAVHTLHPNQLRPGTRYRRRARAVRTH